MGFRSKSVRGSAWYADHVPEISTERVEFCDRVPADLILWHREAPNEISAVYRDEVWDSPLQIVTAHVHKWLFPVTPAANPEKLDMKEADRHAKADEAETKANASKTPKPSRTFPKTR